MRFGVTRGAGGPDHAESGGGKGLPFSRECQSQTLSSLETYENPFEETASAGSRKTDVLASFSSTPLEVRIRELEVVLVIRCISRLLLTLIGFLATSPSALSQTFCGNDDTFNPPPVCISPGNPPGCRPVFDWQSNFIALTRLGNHFMPTFGDGDSMTEPFWLQGGEVNPFGSEGLRETWYIARDQITGTAPLHRLFSTQTGDHMDSPSEKGSEFGYVREFTHGFGFTAPQAGMSLLTRYLRSDIFDHRTWLFTEPPSGYAFDLGLGQYGYQRYGNRLNMCEVFSTAYANPLTNSVFRIDFNRVWGNAIGRITYLPTGLQLVSEQIGAMVQSTLYATDDGRCCSYNPTQSGGIDHNNGANTKRWAGSPILSSQRFLATPPYQIDELKPLNFSHVPWAGTDGYSPLLWRGTFRKTTTLGTLIEGRLFEDVIHIGLEAKKDADAPPTMFNGLYNMNNVYFVTLAPLGDANPQLPDQDRPQLELIDLPTGTTVQQIQPDGFNCELYSNRPSPIDRAVVASNPTGTFAYGFYAPTNPDAYKVLFYCDGAFPTGGNDCHPTPGTCPTYFQMLVFDVFNNRILGSTYAHNENLYFVAGPKAKVIQRLRQIQCSVTGGTNCAVSYFYTVTPCRILDTRNAPGPYGGPGISSGTSRDFMLAGQCQIPTTAASIVLNLTVTDAGSQGGLGAHPTGTSSPPASAISYSSGQTRAKIGIYGLSPDGRLTVRADQPSGLVHVIIDVSGYFE